MKPFIKPVQEKNQMKKVKCKMIYIILPVGILLLIYLSWLYMYKVYLYDFILFDKHNACFNKVDLTGIETGIFGALITAFAIVFSFIKEKILGHTNKIWALRPEYHIFLLKIEDIKAFMNNNFHMINFSVENARKDFNTLLHSI